MTSPFRTSQYAMWRAPRSNPMLRMIDLPSAPTSSCALEHAGVSDSYSGGRSVTLLNDRRPARGLLSRRLASDLEAAAPVMVGVPGAPGFAATGSFNLPLIPS
jgi:hypothetical protein